jgi:hypothetical protein
MSTPSNFKMFVAFNSNSNVVLTSLSSFKDLANNLANNPTNPLVSLN